MARYQRKPPQVEAFQFTGGVENAKSIVQSVAALTSRFRIRWIPGSSEYGTETTANGSEVVETRIPQRLRVETTTEGYIRSDQSNVAQVGDWILVHRGGNVEALTNAEFNAQYQSVT